MPKACLNTLARKLILLVVLVTFSFFLSQENTKIHRPSNDAQEREVPFTLTRNIRTPEYFNHSSVPRYYQVNSSLLSVNGGRTGNSHSSYFNATVVQNAPWLPKHHKMCQWWCCVETVAVSLHQDDTKIINTKDGRDLADLYLPHHPGQEDHDRFPAAVFREEFLPCLLPGTVFHLENHQIQLDYFFKHLRPRIETPYVLITQASDAPSPQSNADDISDPLMQAWYGLNPTEPRIIGKSKDSWESHQKDKFRPVMLGLSFQHNQENYLQPYLQHNNYVNPFLDMSPWNLKKYAFDFEQDVFVHFGLSNHADKLHRNKLWAVLCGNTTASSQDHVGVSCNPETNRVPPSDIYQDASRYRFGISPPGIGWDAYRTYELLLLGVIPIVEERPPFSHAMFEGLPVIQIPNLRNVNDIATIESAIRRYVASPTFPEAKTFAEGWQKLFLGHKRRQILQDSGRDKEIVRDEHGREYYQSYKYTLNNDPPIILCQDPGNCETDRNDVDWRTNKEELKLDPEVETWLARWKDRPSWAYTEEERKASI